MLERRPGAARRRFGIPEGDRCIAVFGGSLGALTVNEAAFAAFAGEQGRRDPSGAPGCSTSPGRRDYTDAEGALGARRRPRALPAARVRALARRRARRLRPGRRARGRLGDGDRRRRAARDPCPLSARDRRPPDHQRPLDGVRGRRDRDRRLRADPRAAARRGGRRCSATRARLRADGGGGPPASRARTPRSGSPPRCWRPPAAGAG